MLSPCIWQVIHALLTRPPLTDISLGFHICPFDLHVLGTPPAFILSQDQTLMFFRSLLPVPSGFRQSLSGFYRLFLSVLLFLWVDLFTDLFSEISLWAPRFQTAFQRLLRFSLFRIFRVALLFICQGSSASGLPSALLSLSAATLIEYHMSFALSTAFFNFTALFFSCLRVYSARSCTSSKSAPAVEFYYSILTFFLSTIFSITFSESLFFTSAAKP